MDAVGSIYATMTNARPFRLGQQIPPWRCAPRRNDKGLGVGWGRQRFGGGREQKHFGGWAGSALLRSGGTGEATIATRSSECALEILGAGWVLVDGDGDFDGYFCAGGIGVDFHGALKLADAFTHTADAEAGSSRSDLAKTFGGHARSVITDLGRDVSLRAGHGDRCFCRTGVTMDVSEGFLDETEEYEFQIAGKPPEVI